MTDNQPVEVSMERLFSVMKCNLAHYHGQTLTPELIERISSQIVESVNYFTKDEVKEDFDNVDRI